jgi:hypothetical protein
VRIRRVRLRVGPIDGKIYNGAHTPCCLCTFCITSGNGSPPKGYTALPTAPSCDLLSRDPKGQTEGPIFTNAGSPRGAMASCIMPLAEIDAVRREGTPLAGGQRGVACSWGARPGRRPDQSHLRHCRGATTWRIPNIGMPKAIKFQERPRLRRRALPHPLPRQGNLSAE